MHTDVDNPLETRRNRRHSTRRLGVLGLAAVILLVILFGAGYIPRRRLHAELQADAQSAAARTRQVNAARVERSAPSAPTTLPGNIQAMDETAVYARADGYLKRRLADIGDQVRAGQLLAEIETPELDQQIRQARAALEQTRAAAGRAHASVGQAQANLRLASVTANRWQALVAKGVLSQQEGDQRQSELAAREADLRAAEAAAKAADADVLASEANVQRLIELQGFRKVTAPFAGVITARNVDTGTLITAGSGSSARQLFNLAQIDRLRIFVDVPQAFAASVRPGQPADVSVQEMPGEKFRGTVTRTSNALDPRSRTLLTEVQLPNPGRRLLPGMYAQVTFTVTRAAPPVVVPSDALMVRAGSTYVLLVDASRTVRYRKVTLGRDYGPQVEITSGLNGGENVIVNPTDDLQDGETVSANLR